MKWNEITWYSRLFGIIILLGIIPATAFYMGMQFQSTTSIINDIEVEIIDTKGQGVATNVVDEAMQTMAIATSTQFTEECELIPHFALTAVPYGWKPGLTNSSFVGCLRPTTFYSSVRSPDYMETSNSPEAEYGDLVLVKGGEFSIYADTDYPHTEQDICDSFPDSDVKHLPVTDVREVEVAGYKGMMGYVQESENAPSPSIDYYTINVRIPEAPCQRIEFVAVASSTNESTLNIFLDNLRFYR